VLQADVGQTLRSWVYRAWVLLSVAAAVGYLLYRLGADREAGMVQPASRLISDLLRWTVFVSVTLIIMLTAGSISSERGNLADSVLSRGISRYQYFLGKWHARLLTVLGTFFLLAGLMLTGSFLLLHQDLTPHGSVAAVVTVAALLATVITWGVTISALSSSSVLGIAVLWVILYGSGFLLSLLPEPFPSPERALSRLPNILRGFYDVTALGWVVGTCLALCAAAALVGLFQFGRRDV
jgi:hypothetical protein